MLGLDVKKSADQIDFGDKFFVLKYPHERVVEKIQSSEGGMPSVTGWDCGRWRLDG
ncbi:hypothetical protein RUM43_013113 [Polyplax serrata]|uniref:Uncharacterized protein n=1 Tax=Polyplax serrata TaxID=468196 RepID=A0AAN8NQW3_POLSC